MNSLPGTYSGLDCTGKPEPNPRSLPSSRRRTIPHPFTFLIKSDPARATELLHVLMLSDFDRADRIGEFWSYPESRTFAELLIDCEEDRSLRAVPIGMLRENYRWTLATGTTRGTESIPSLHQQCQQKKESTAG
jgi:hypothetical protein